MVDAKSLREQTIREAKCTLILDAAREVFAQNGFHAARLEDIAARAGFSKGSLYNYYDNKELIFLNLAIREYEALHERVKESIGPNDTLETSLRNVTGCIFDVMGAHFTLLMEIWEFRCQGFPGLSEILKSHHDLFSVFKRFATALQETVATIFARARSRGEVRTALSDTVLAAYYGAMIRGIVFNWKMNEAMGDVAQESEMMIAFFMNGVRAPLESIKTGDRE